MPGKIVNVKYIGNGKKAHSNSVFRGFVEPGHTIKVAEENLEYYRLHKDWEVSSQETKKSKAKEDVKEEK